MSQSVTLQIKANTQSAVADVKELGKQVKAAFTQINEVVAAASAELRKLTFNPQGILEGAEQAARGLGTVNAAAGSALAGLQELGAASGEAGGKLAALGTQAEGADRTLGTLAGTGTAVGSALADVEKGAAGADTALLSLEEGAATAQKSVSGLGRVTGNLVPRLESLSKVVFDPAGIVTGADTAITALDRVKLAAAEAKGAVLAAGHGGGGFGPIYPVGGRPGLVPIVPKSGLRTGAGALLDVGGAGAAITALLAAVTGKLAANFDNLLQKERGNTTMSDTDFRDMRAQTLKLMKRGTPAEELAKGYAHIQNMNYHGQDAAHILDESNRLGIATGTSTEDTAQVGARLSREYNQPASRIRAVLETAHLTSAGGDMHLQEFDQYAGKAFATGANSKVSMPEVAAMLRAMTQHGLDISKASTQAVGLITQMRNPTPQALKYAQSIGVGGYLGSAALEKYQPSGILAAVQRATGGDAQKMGNIFKARQGGLGASILTGMGEGAYHDALNNPLTGTKAAFAGKTNAIDPLYAAQMKQTAQAFKALSGEFQASLIPIGARLAPVFLAAIPLIKALTSGITKLLDGFSRLPRPMQEVVLALGGFKLIQSFLPMLTGFSLISEKTGVVIRGLGGAFKAALLEAGAGEGVLAGLGVVLTGPVGIAIAATIAAVAALALAWKTDFGGIREHTANVINWMKPYLSGAWSSITGTAKAAWKGLQAPLATVWGWIKAGIFALATNIKERITRMVEAGLILRDGWNFLRKEFSIFGHALQAGWAFAVDGFKRGVADIGSHFAWLQGPLKDLKKVAGDVWGGMAKSLEDAKNKIIGFLGPLGASLSAWWNNLPFVKYLNEKHDQASGLVSGVLNGPTGTPGGIGDLRRGDDNVDGPRRTPTGPIGAHMSQVAEAMEHVKGFNGQCDRFSRIISDKVNPAFDKLYSHSSALATMHGLMARGIGQAYKGGPLAPGMLAWTGRMGHGSGHAMHIGPHGGVIDDFSNGEVPLSQRKIDWVVNPDQLSRVKQAQRRGQALPLPAEMPSTPAQEKAHVRVENANYRATHTKYENQRHAALETYQSAQKSPDLSSADKQTAHATYLATLTRIHAAEEAEQKRHHDKTEKAEGTHLKRLAALHESVLQLYQKGSSRSAKTQASAHEVRQHAQDMATSLKTDPDTLALGREEAAANSTYRHQKRILDAARPAGPYSAGENKAYAAQVAAGPGAQLALTLGAIHQKRTAKSDAEAQTALDEADGAARQSAATTVQMNRELWQHAGGDMKAYFKSLTDEADAALKAVTDKYGPASAHPNAAVVTTARAEHAAKVATINQQSADAALRLQDEVKAHDLEQSKLSLTDYITYLTSRRDAYAQYSEEWLALDGQIYQKDEELQRKQLDAIEELFRKHQITLAQYQKMLADMAAKVPALSPVHREIEQAADGAENKSSRQMVGGGEFWDGLAGSAADNGSRILNALLHPRDKKAIFDGMWKDLLSSGENALQGSLAKMFKNALTGSGNGDGGLLGGLLGGLFGHKGAAAPPATSAASAATSVASQAATSAAASAASGGAASVTTGAARSAAGGAFSSLSAVAPYLAAAEVLSQPQVVEAITKYVDVAAKATSEVIGAIGKLASGVISAYYSGIAKVVGSVGTAFKGIGEGIGSAASGIGKGIHSVISSFTGADAMRVSTMNVAKMDHAIVIGGGGGLAGLGGGLLGGLLGGVRKLLHFEKGGLPPVGIPSLVGERGPELFLPSVSGRIFTADQTRAAFTPQMSLPSLVSAGSYPSGARTGSVSADQGTSGIVFNDYGDKHIHSEMDANAYATANARKLERGRRRGVPSS